MGQVIQVFGAVFILAAFALAQWGFLDQKSLLYLVLNVVGSAVLAVDAALGVQWGFLLLEGVWAIVSLVSLIAVLWQRKMSAGRPTQYSSTSPRIHVM